METTMTDDRIAGGLRKGLGHVQDAVGGLTGDGRTQAEGKLNQAAGSVQDMVGQARDRAQDLYEEVGSYAKEQPLVALGVALGVGVLAGMLLIGGRKTVYVRK
jgi:uncharacterized protein YjbJ (UPF0337 family)